MRLYSKDVFLRSVFSIPCSYEQQRSNNFLYMFLKDYDLWQIQHEVIKTFISCKSYIEEEGIKRKFGFKDNGSSKQQHHTL